VTPPSQSATRQKIQSADYRTTAKRCGDTRKSVCHNGLLARIELVDQAVLGAIGEDVLQADILTAALDGARRPAYGRDRSRGTGEAYGAPFAD